MQNYLKWLLITCVFGALYGVSEWQFQLFSGMAEKDSWGICYTLWGLMGFVVLESFFRCNKLSIAKLATVSFIASLLGLLGTFLGMRDGFGAVDIAGMDATNQEAVQATMGNLFLCLYLALNTTITGIFVSLPALTYMYFLGDKNAVS